MGALYERKTRNPLLSIISDVFLPMEKHALFIVQLILYFSVIMVVVGTMILSGVIGFAMTISGVVLASESGMVLIKQRRTVKPSSYDGY